MQVPPNIYDNFLGVYPAWLKAESIIKAKADYLIRISETLNDEILNTDQLQSLTKDVNLSRIPCGELCPICFSEGSEKVFIALDGNFQLTTLGTKLEKKDGVAVQDLEDKRLFVEKDPFLSVVTIGLDDADPGLA